MHFYQIIAQGQEEANGRKPQRGLVNKVIEMSKKNQERIWHSKEVEMSKEGLDALQKTENAIAEKLARFAAADENSPCEQGLSIDPVDLTVVLQALEVIEKIHDLRYADRQARASTTEASDLAPRSEEKRGEANHEKHQNPA